MEMLNALLINLLFILLLSLIMNMITWNKYRSFIFNVGKVNYFLIAAIQIAICMFCSISFGNGFLYDLRLIPFLIGSLYGGVKVTISLAAYLIFIRFLFGGDGFWTAFILTIIISSLIIWIRPYFLRKSTRWRVALVTTVSFAYAIFGFLIPSLLYDFHSKTTFLIFTIVLTGSTFFVSYLIEVLRTLYILQLEATKLEKMEIVSHLAASISHEVRNPLTAVIGFLQLISEHKETNEECKSYATYAINEANRASDIINDYLTFAKPHPDEVYMMDLEKEIQKSIEIIRPLSIKQNVELMVEYAHKGNIKGDPHKFHQVLLNIFKNSMDAMPNGGILSIKTYELDNYIHIKVKDTGVGMKREHIARLGEPYFSLKEHKGTGLGMMVVFRIVESMRGSVKVSSELYVGTSMTLSFPLIRKEIAVTSK